MQSPQIELAELGYAVFPCVPGQKRPLTKNGLLDATTDTEQIERWIAEYPDANWGLVTDGLVVVDIDKGAEHWPTDERQAAELAKADAIVVTPNGRHFYFRAPDGSNYRNTQSRLADKVDTRANGGYVICPPSCVNGKSYEWANGELPPAKSSLSLPPQWIVKALAEAPARPAADAPIADDGTIPEGRRNGSLASLAGAMRHLGATEPEILSALRLANQTRCKPPLEDKEVATVAHSIASYPPAEVKAHLAAREAQEETADDKSPDDPGPLPPNLLSVPGFVAAVVEHNLAGAFRPQPALALAGALSLLATLTGRKVTDSQGTRTNLYCLGVCGTSTGKERARQVNKDVLYKAGLEAMIGSESIGSAQGLVTAIDQQPAQLFQLDEFGRYLRTMGNASEPHLFNIISVLMRLFTSSASIYIGDAVVDERRVKRISQPHACVHGTTTPEALYNALTVDSVSDGFLSRVLIFEGDDQPPRLRPHVPETPQSLIDAARWWGDFRPGGNTSPFVAQPIIVESSAAANAIFGQFERASDAEQISIGPPLGSLWPRAVEKAGKLALLYACSENAQQPRISDAAATWAVDLVTHLTRRLTFLASRWLASNRQEREVKSVARIIEAAGRDGIDKSHLTRATQWLKRRDRDEILQTLIESGEVVPDHVATATKPRTIYRSRRYAAA